MLFSITLLFALAATPLAKASLTHCQSQREKALHSQNNIGLVGVFVPTCLPDGSYNSTQCSGSTGRCFCVDTATGTEIVGTSQLAFQFDYNCSAAITQCQRQREQALDRQNNGGLVGVFVPSCLPDGSYNSTQCSGSTGRCFCVDTATGTEIVGTSKLAFQFDYNCEAAITHCQSQRNKALHSQNNIGLVGVFVPMCLPDGSYNSTQCSGSTGRCFCVDTTTGSEIVGTSKLAFQFDYNCEAAVTHCQRQREQALDRQNNGGLVGVFVPTCLPDGSYNSTQCWASTGRCFCVNTTSGERIDGTSMLYSQFHWNCPASPTHCQRQRKKALHSQNNIGLVGVFVPTCLPDGLYNSTQCSGSTGRCFCVDTATGTEIVGTSKLAFQFDYNCSAAITQCQRQREQALDRQNNGGLVGVFVPSCLPDGSYNSTQCSGSTGRCFCVDTATGTEIVGTSKLAFQFDYNCEAAITHCQRRREQALDSQNNGGLLGVFVPSCLLDGSYNSTQCWASTGRCFCVDTDTGKEIVGTSKLAFQFNHDCSVSLTHCQSRREQALDRQNNGGLVGVFIPTCLPDGSYNSTQCWASTGRCFCVNTTSGERIDGRSMLYSQFYFNCSVSLTLCQRQREEALHAGNDIDIFGRFIPTCSPDGLFAPTQCLLTGVCYCVDVLTGEKISGTSRLAFMLSDLDCSEICGPSPKAPKNGFVKCNGTTLNSQCEFGCNEHYTRVGPSHKYCVRKKSGKFKWIWSHSTTCSNCPPTAMVDFAIVLDSSPSVGQAKWNIVIEFVKNITKPFHLGDNSTRFAVFRYNRKVDETTQILLNKYRNRQKFTKALDDIQYNGRGRKTGRALRHALGTIFKRRNGDRRNARNVLMLITFGRSQDRAIRISNRLRNRRQATIFILGIGTNLNKAELEATAGNPNNVVQVDNVRQLNDHQKSFITRLCN